MKLYLVKDKMSSQVIDVVLSTNLDTYKRQFINSYLSIKEKNNFAAIRLWNDCVVYEVDVRIPGRGDCLDHGEIILESDSMSTHSDNGLILSVVLVLKDFIAEFEAKKGTNLDKSE